MDRRGAEVAAEAHRELVAHPLGRAEDDDARAGRLGLQQLAQARHLLGGAAAHAPHHVDVLRDRRVGDEAVLDLADEDADGVGLDELGRDGLDLFVF